VKVADVLPVPPPVIPSWVPELVVQSIRGQYEIAAEGAYVAAARQCGFYHEFDDDRVPPEFAAALSRDDELRANVADFVRDELADMAEQPLVCDPRMQSVWRQLFRRRPTGEFYYPARVPSASTAKERQDLAMLELFNVAFSCKQNQHGETTTRGALEQWRDRYLARAKELRAEGRMMLEQTDDWPSGMERSQAMEVAARALEDYAREVYATNSAMAFDRKRDSRARWVALTIGTTFCKLFGEPMYSLSAKITSVILGREIATGTVRYWWDRAVKTPKSAP
jgi:hypothetical protein